MALRQDTVVRTALRLLEEVGLDGLSLRRLAKVLGVQPAALYWHIKDKQELLDLMAEEMLAGEFAALRPPAPEEPWQDWLRDLAWRLRRSLRTHRDGARIFAGARPVRGTLQVMDQLVVVLLRAGFGPQDALRNGGVVVSYTLGFVLDEQAAAAAFAADGTAPENVGAALASGDYPVLGEVLATVGRPNPDADFRHGTELMVAGMSALATAATGR
ncbi:TetR/AcrR family transcriptional regulator C-terminal domain-containing protein [Kitasatospora sp. NPDC057198]|uniref:TetR/AcrR family transcriptional regulator C-terminal domain-containing protein n=1 Tax=Kitasatospora sp. NPDC057198 TaxID=3346046 RepID=UPI0036373D9C